VFCGVVFGQVDDVFGDTAVDGDFAIDESGVARLDRERKQKAATGQAEQTTHGARIEHRPPGDIKKVSNSSIKRT
jgi:hypothetical protein